MKKIIIAVVLLGFIGGGIGLYMYNKPVDKMNTMKVDETISAENLFTTYEADETAANSRFLDKVVVVKGKVIKSTKDDTKITVFLDTGDMLANIMCQMESQDINIPADGSTVTIKGLCTGYLTDVVLIKSILI